MKKLLTLLALCAALVLTLTACGGSDAPAAEEPEDTVVEGDTSETYAPLATDLANEFLHLVDTAEDPSALTLAEDFLAVADLPFEAMVMPVEPGLLMGFGNTEITGFSQGVMFGPSISSIPFLGYVFQLDGSVDGSAFCQTLKSNADLRWNICTAAEEMVAVQSGSYVFFLMCPSSLEG
ncbi:MAG: hypothetical protein IKY34_06740 [Ruminiclostridium sp.]|nr:hypothetical protein [Ruminiclostridium sp.]